MEVPCLYFPSLSLILTVFSLEDTVNSSSFSSSSPLSLSAWQSSSPTFLKKIVRCYNKADIKVTLIHADNGFCLLEEVVSDKFNFTNVTLPFLLTLIKTVLLSCYPAFFKQGGQTLSLNPVIRKKALFLSKRSYD